MLLPALHHAKSLYGWLPPEVQEAISHALRVPLADIHGVVEFYTMFYNEPTARQVVRICEDVACRLHGAEAVMAAVEAETGLASGETSNEDGLTYERVPCLGMCEFAPVALNGDTPAGELTAATVPAFLAGAYPEPEVRVYGNPRLTLGRVGEVDPASLVSYDKHGGYDTLRAALKLAP